MAELHEVLDPPGRKTFELYNKQHEIIVTCLLEQVHRGQLPRGAIKNMALHFHVSRQTISTIWNKYINARSNGTESLSIIHKEIRLSRPNLKYGVHALGHSFKEILYDYRGSFWEKCVKMSTTGGRWKNLLAVVNCGVYCYVYNTRIK